MRTVLLIAGVTKARISGAHRPGADTNLDAWN